jgi:protein-S-isoprenylcysteine O-methyltransferase Ste14
MIGSGLIGIADFETLGNGYWIFTLVGGFAILTGGGIAYWAMRTLSIHQSLGLKGKLVTEGPYQHSRNPQYIDFILMYTGVILMTYSFMALVTGTIMIALFAIFLSARNHG